MFNYLISSTISYPYSEISLYNNKFFLGIVSVVKYEKAYKNVGYSSSFQRPVLILSIEIWFPQILEELMQTVGEFILRPL